MIKEMLDLWVVGLALNMKIERREYRVNYVLSMIFETICYLIINDPCHCKLVFNYFSPNHWINHKKIIFKVENLNYNQRGSGSGRRLILCG